MILFTDCAIHNICCCKNKSAFVMQMETVCCTVGTVTHNMIVRALFIKIYNSRPLFHGMCLFNLFYETFFLLFPFNLKIPYFPFLLHTRLFLWPNLQRYSLLWICIQFLYKRVNAMFFFFFEKNLKLFFFALHQILLHQKFVSINVPRRWGISWIISDNDIKKVL